MTLPTPSIVTPTNQGSNIRTIAAQTTPGIVNSVATQLGAALLVYDPSGGSDGGKGQLGTQVVTANATSQKISVGSMVVQQGSSLKGSVATTAPIPGVLLIADGNGKTLAVVPFSGSSPTSFDATKYPRLAYIGSQADNNNNVLGNYTSLGSVPIGLQYKNGTQNPVAGWTGQGPYGESIQPGVTPFILKSFYISPYDNVPAVAFIQNNVAGYATNTASPSRKGIDVAQTIVLYDPNGQPIANTAYNTPNSVVVGGASAPYFGYFPPNGNMIPGWWSIADLGQQNDYYSLGNDPGINNGGGIIGGGTFWDTSVVGMYATGNHGGAFRFYQPTANGQYYNFYPFNWITRLQYQGAVQLYRQKIQTIVFTALFATNPGAGTVTVSGAS